MQRRERGQGLVEYALILVLVAVVVIAVLLLLGPVIGNIFSNIILIPEYRSSTTSSLSQDANKKGGDSLDFYKEFRDLSLYQEAALNEAKQQLQEAAVETFEVLIEYAEEIGDDVLYALVMQAQQAASGDYANLPSALEEVFVALGETPPEVQVAVIKKVVPYVINSYWALDGAQVPYEAFEAALQEIEQHEAQDPGSTGEAIPLMYEIWDLVGQRNTLIGEAQPALLTAACYGITGLNNTGIPENIELAQQYLAQLPPSPCDN